MQEKIGLKNFGMKYTEKKRSKPCGACPFKRVNSLEGPEPGGSPVHTYLGQTRGPFWLPCHKDKNYEAKESDPGVVTECAGAAIFRSNCNSKYTLPKELLSLPEDKELVFANEAEFVAHYLKLDPENIKKVLTEEVLDNLLKGELQDANAKRH